MSSFYNNFIVEDKRWELFRERGSEVEEREEEGTGGEETVGAACVLALRSLQWK